ncbi:hypothetical protein Pint_31319 [Pistacia integerrima]|uniref:Uncharacterized protein n=1 Tax=Pistacia integerrima TaxID=434235 RepID=A0ACC0XP07_9ROSI|nr:hypothetical protein Pint_31319 [Pistacia integerrima]
MLVYLKFLGNKQKSFLSIAAVDSLSRLLDLKESMKKKSQDLLG